MASHEKSFRFNNHCMDLKIQHSFSHTEEIKSSDNPLLTENIAFLKALKDNTHNAIHSPFDDAIKRLKVSIAADISIKESRPLTLSSL